ncbi:hypothetical protein ACVJGB_002220 [Bradyrhizobium liaoningense]
MTGSIVSVAHSDGVGVKVCAFLRDWLEISECFFCFGPEERKP